MANVQLEELREYIAQVYEMSLDDVPERPYLCEGCEAFATEVDAEGVPLCKACLNRTGEGGQTQ
ncbi:MAG: hypothetical protein HC888_11270 [Candidatus Competibacteraceae bacterium]|nr:hypothetical protein [Candidatus Competibacteraceae bacterium]